MNPKITFTFSDSTGEERVHINQAFKDAPWITRMDLLKFTFEDALSRYNEAYIELIPEEQMNEQTIIVNYLQLSIEMIEAAIEKIHTNYPNLCPAEKAFAPE